MGYHTFFDGEIAIDPPLNEHERSFLTDFNRSRRMHRSRGPLFVKGSDAFGQGRDPDIIDFNEPWPEQPGLWCQWVPNGDGTCLEWDEGEKFYEAAAWMKYLVTHLLAPSAKDYVSKHLGNDDRLTHFTFNHVLNGRIHAQGEDPDDRWILDVTDNVVGVSTAVITYPNATPI